MLDGVVAPCSGDSRLTGDGSSCVPCDSGFLHVRNGISFWSGWHALKASAMEEDGCGSVSEVDAVMVDGGLQSGGAAGKQSCRLCFVKEFGAPGIGISKVDCMLSNSPNNLPNASLPPSSKCNACVNAGKVPLKQNLGLSGAGCPSNPWSHKLKIRMKPKVVPLPSSKELGQFSFDSVTAILDEKVVDATLKKFDAALIGRMFGRRIPYLQLLDVLSHQWDVFGKFRLVTLSGDFFVCFFDDVEAHDAVLMGDPWVIFGQVLGVDKWTSSFSPSSLEGFDTPYWIRLQGLPLYCWSSANIARIAALMGEHLWLDSATDQLEKGLFAHACVRIDLSKPLKPGVWVQGRHGKFYLSLVYEGLSIFCFRCCQVGHKEHACKVQASCGVKIIATPSPSSGMVQAPLDDQVTSVGIPQELVMSAQKINLSTSDIQKEVPRDDGLHLEDRGAGPWMIVQRKRRSPKATSHGKNQEASFGQPVPSALLYTVKATPRGTSPPHRNSFDGCVELLLGDSPSRIFIGFTASAKGAKVQSPRTIKVQLARSARTFKKKMVNNLGPISHGS